jgi:uncharacterized protein (TIGR02466 family)
MELLPIFPRHLGIKHFEDIPNKVIDSWKDYIKSLPLIPLHNNPSNNRDFLTKSQRLLEDPIFSELKNQIINYSRRYVRDIGFHVEDVQISNSWSYITKQNNIEGNYHHHDNSLVSGVFYLTKGSPLIFKTDLHQHSTFKTEILENNITQMQYQYASIMPKKGLLVLFPSHLQHGVVKNEEDVTRISIPFNIIPKGEFGTLYQKLYL